MRFYFKGRSLRLVASRFMVMALAIVALPILASAAVASPGVAFGTPVTADNLDQAAFAEWSDGVETGFDGASRERVPAWVIYTQTSGVGARAIEFGVTKTPGPRHLRIGFKAAVPVGSVLVNGGGALSVLKPSADYPGDLADEAQWLPATRLAGGDVVTSEVSGYALWVLPPGTSTRALRFTHVAELTDRRYAGSLGGALVLPERLANIAPQATAAASINAGRAKNLINESSDGFWGAWENQPKHKPGDSAPITATHAEWLVLDWRRPVELDGLVTLFTGASQIEVQVYHGIDPTTNPATTGDEAWITLKTFSDLKHHYPNAFYPERLDFGHTVSARALRLRLTAPPASTAHTTNNDGRRVWMGEVMALAPLGKKNMSTLAVVTPEAEATPPPIAVKFTLKEPGYVTLVIERPDGFRVRNLISETWFPAGENIAWWDGTDDLTRDVDAVMHGLYRIPARFVAPGEYRVRGLVRAALKPSYEFSVYATGNPPWNTADSTGAWLANHSAPQAAAFVPASQSPTGEPTVYLGCYITEGPAGLAWVDLDGRKRGGKKWIGGSWTAAPFLAANTGADPVADVHVFVASSFEQSKKSELNELRLSAITSTGDKSVLTESLDALLPGTRGEKAIRSDAEIGGVAVYNGTMVVSLRARNRLLLVDVREGKVLGDIAVDSPRGVAFDAQGRLLVLSDRELMRFDVGTDPAGLSAPQTLTSVLENPTGLALDQSGRIYVSDLGRSHQVKVFSAEGRLERTIGKPGVPAVGPYDPLRMQNPAGLAIDAKNQLWVAEHDYLPKRVSVWTLDGKLINAFYGPAKYGGGGALDPKDKTLFYYADESRGAMAFKLDWAKGTYALQRVYYRPGADDNRLLVPRRVAAPETALYYEGRRYFTNAYNNSPTGGSNNVLIYADREGVVRPVAAVGRVADWVQFQAPEFASLLPAGFSFASRHPSKRKGFFIWSDTNGDGQIQPEEVATSAEDATGVTVMPDLSFSIARVGEKSLRYKPVSFVAGGVPTYDMNTPQVLATGVKGPASSGGNQMLVFPDGRAAITLGVGPFDALSVSGTQDGVAQWSYPNLWPGLHASHRAPRPDRPGQLIGMTRLPGGAFDVAGSDAGPFWALHSNHGQMAFFTADGLFVGNVFSDMRSGKSWRMPAAGRGMDLSDVTLGEENFWPTLSHTSAGNVYLVDGARSAIVRIEGFDTIRRLTNKTLNVSTQDLKRSRAWVIESEATRQSDVGDGLLKVVMRPAAPVVDGKLDEWSPKQFVAIDKSGVKANFNSSSKPYDVSAAVAVSDDRLYAAWRTGLPKLLVNSGEMPLAPFKTGGALDMMIGADPAADPTRSGPVSGDARLVVTLVDGKPWALLYRGVVPGTSEADKVPFTSPVSTITMDRVDDVTSLIEFAGTDGNYELSIPLATLGLRLHEGMRIQGDIGILRGNGNETVARVYWHNKATGITADVPSEAALTPRLWGIWEFQKP